MNARTGLVVARFRRHVTIEDELGERRVCQLGRRTLDPVVGDRALWHATADGGIVTDIEPRRTCLYRIDKRGRPEAVAANLTHLIVVIAPVPTPDWQLLDRYLCASLLADLEGVIVYNKADLVAHPPPALEIYRRAGYPVLITSASQGAGLVALAERLRLARSAVVGQSGVGKSSLINALLGTSAQTVGALTEKGSHGQHTTSTAVLYRLPLGGELIDSPGVRGYAPPLDRPEQLAHGFREFRPHLGQCRFANCMHLAEPDCAVKQAVTTGLISRSRYDSYVQLQALRERLPTPRH